MLRITLPLLLGIVLEGVIHTSLHHILLGLSFIITVVFSSMYYRFGFSNRWMTGAALNLFLCVGGYWLAVEAREVPPYPDSYSGIFTVKVLEIPEEKERSFKLKGSLLQELRGDSLYKVGQELLLYAKKDSGVFQLKPGDMLLAKLRLQKPSNALNPGDFDYRNYLAVHGTYYTAFVNLAESRKLPASSEFDLTIFLRNLRAQLIQKLPDYGITGNNLAIFSALTLGYTGYIDTETRNDFVASGAMHVLSVSGLHVAIVYLVFSYMLGLTSKSRKYVKPRAFVVIILLWAYAFLTGLPACVLRSTIMFCFVVGARIFQRQSNIYNSVAASAFVLLIYDPLLIYDIGFQLSYLALLSIVYFQPLISGLFTFKSWLARNAWELTAVSFAAQVATTPISIAVFGQFPVYFWLSNIFVIFLSTLLLYFAVPFVILACISPFLGKLVGLGIAYLLDALRFTTNFVEQLPGSVITGLHLTSLQASLLVLAVIMFGFYLETRRKLSLAIALTCCCAVFLIDSVSIIKHKQQQMVAVFAVRNGKAIAFIEGRSATVLWSGAELSNATVARALNAPVQHYRIKALNLIPLDDVGKSTALPIPNSYLAKESILLVSYAGKRVAIQLKKPDFYVDNLPEETRLRVDVLYSDSPYLAKIAMNIISPELVITGKNISQRQLAIASKARWWSIPSQGAYLLSVSR